jgi:ABC-type Fe3+ transport system permease subunit
MKEFFEYHYYRIAKFNFKREGSFAFSALLSVSSVQLLVIVNVLLFLQSLFSDIKRKTYLYEKIIFVIILLFLLYFNFRKYNKKYFEFREKWKNEDKKTRILKGVIIIFTILLSWGLFFINGFIFGKFKN